MSLLIRAEIGGGGVLLLRVEIEGNEDLALESMDAHQIKEKKLMTGHTFAPIPPRWLPILLPLLPCNELAAPYLVV